MFHPEGCPPLLVYPRFVPFKQTSSWGGVRDLTGHISHHSLLASQGQSVTRTRPRGHIMLSRMAKLGTFSGFGEANSDALM